LQALSHLTLTPIARFEPLPPPSCPQTSCAQRFAECLRASRLGGHEPTADFLFSLAQISSWAAALRFCATGAKELPG
jgi:hypothetical protein